jgi:hypothetical protein
LHLNSLNIYESPCCFILEGRKEKVMNKFWIAVAVACLFTVSAFARTAANSPAAGNVLAAPVQTSSAAAGTEGHGLSNGTTLQAELTKSIDVKKAKSGDEVTGKVTQDVKVDGKVVIQKGSKLVGHVTEAQSKAKDAESKLGVVFDKAVLKGGQDVTFNGVIVALSAPAEVPSSTLGGGSIDRSSTSDGRTRIGPSPYGASPSMPAPVAGSQPGTPGNIGPANSGAAGPGLTGMDGVAMNATAAGTVFHSTSKNIKLDSGAQIVLQVAAPPAAK